ncbi:MAG: 50S ribosomal protein L15 [Thermodesulfobacteriota bacterium]
MKLHEIHPFYEERKNKKRLGRGQATGTGCTSGKGNKGQRSRAGSNPPAWFEGGQMPLQRRTPKRGFTNTFRVEYHSLNLDTLSRFFPEQSEVRLSDIYERGLCPRHMPVKVLARGDMDRAITVEAHKFSKQAAEKIKAAGGEPIAIEG